MTVSRAPDAPESSPRDTLAAWDAALVASGLPVPVADTAKPKPRVAFAAPLSVGTSRKKEKSVAAVRENPNSSPPMMVAPAREVPGTSARHCAQPILSASRQLM